MYNVQRRCKRYISFIIFFFSNFGIFGCVTNNGGSSLFQNPSELWQHKDPETEAAKGNSAIHFIIYTCTFHVKMSPGLINKISIQ